MEKQIFRATGRDISLGPSPPGVRVDIIEQTENSITWQETEMTTDNKDEHGSVSCLKHNCCLCEEPMNQPTEQENCS